MCEAEQTSGSVSDHCITQAVMLFFTHYETHMSKVETDLTKANDQFHYPCDFSGFSVVS